MLSTVSVLVLDFTGVADAATGPDPAGTIYVSDESSHSMDVFAPGSNGNVAPTRTISGSNTGLGPGFRPTTLKSTRQETSGRQPSTVMAS